MVSKPGWPRPMTLEERQLLNETRGIKPRVKRQAKCKRCRRVFHPTTKTQRFCSRECYQVFLVTKKRADNRVLKVTIQCERCQMLFSTSRSAQRFCSRECRIAATKARQKEQRRQVKMAEFKSERCGDAGAIIGMLEELPDGVVLCAYEIGTRLGYRFGERTMNACKWLEALETAGLIKSWRDSKRFIWLRSWQMVEKGTGDDGKWGCR